MKKIFIIMFFYVLTGPCSFANEVGKMSISIMPGISVPVAGEWTNSSLLIYDSYGPINANYGAKTSFALTGAVDYRFHKMMTGGIELGYDFKHSTKYTNAIKTQIFHLTPFIRIDRTFDHWTPYGVLGIGYYNVKATVADNSSANGYLGFNLGTGIDYELTNELSVGLDIRWHHIFSNNSQFGGAQPDINNIVPSVKFTYSFDI